MSVDSYLEQEVGGEGQAAQAELLEGLDAAETGGAAVAAAASGEAAAGKPTAGWPPAAAARKQQGAEMRRLVPSDGSRFTRFKTHQGLPPQFGGGLKV